MDNCKCGHTVSIHEHYNDGTKCGQALRYNEEGIPTEYCTCRGPHPFFRHLKFWLG